MENSEGENVRVIDVNGNIIEGYVDLFESRYDNEDDEMYPGEASIGLDCENEKNCLIYEKDIESIEII